jgi:hypothetical protein
MSSPEPEMKMGEKPQLFVCHGDDGGPRMHPCRRVQEALGSAGIQYDKVLAAHGSPLPSCAKARVPSCAMRPAQRGSRR